MGKSKFPEKPNKSVMKQRIRMLNKNECERRQDIKGISDDTKARNDKNNINDDTNIKNQFSKDENTKNCNRKAFQVQIKLNRSSSNTQGDIANHNLFNNLDNKKQNVKKICSCFHRTQSNGRTVALTRNFDQILEPIKTPTGNINLCVSGQNNNIQKKSVTFKNIPETSDDILISRSIHNALKKGPLVSIMKKKCVKSQRFVPRKDRIVRPSQLTKFDKTKFLSFRSLQLPIKSFDFHQTNNLSHQQEQVENSILPKEKINTKELKMKDHNENLENCEKATTENQYKQLLDKWNLQKIDYLNVQGKDAENQRDKHSSKGRVFWADNQNILRTPRLLVMSNDEISEYTNQNTFKESSDVTVSAGELNKCSILPLSKNNIKNLKKINNKRCTACWLKKCIQSLHLPSRHEIRLNSVKSGNPNTEMKNDNTSQKAAIRASSKTQQQDSVSLKKPVSTGNIKESAKFPEETTFPKTIIKSNNLTLSNAKSTDGNTYHAFLFNKNSQKTSKKDIEIMEESYKRQKIAFTGPRVKHVCRSASIALGQQIATFSNDNEKTLLLSTFDIEKKSISKILNRTIELPGNEEEDRMSQKKLKDIRKVQTECRKPRKNVDKENDNVVNAKLDMKRDTTKVFLTSDESRQRVPTERKSLFSLAHENKGSTPRKKSTFITNIKSWESKSKMISIDFWDTYVPGEVNQNGLGLIFSKSSSVTVLCFLCGSMDLNKLLFCASCCEPYHSYCIQEYFSTDIASDIIHWICPRCTVCETCNMSSGIKIKCKKCEKNYHNTCLGTPKGLLGSNQPLICRNCLRCEFCSTLKVSKYIGNQAICNDCFYQKRSISSCLHCKMSVDNTLDLIIVECGVCYKFVHAKCEGLTEEQSYLLSSIASSIKFVCKTCSLSSEKAKKFATDWEDAVYKELKSRLLEVIKLLSKCSSADIFKKSPNLDCMCDFDKINKYPIEPFNVHATQYKSKKAHNFKLNNLLGSPLRSKCLCSKLNCLQLTNNAFRLIDIKKKIINEEYFSLLDFNEDMNNVILPFKNDELILTYKEIISQQFSWFQNETKTCTDALETDMFDSYNFSFQADNVIMGDQSLSTKIPYPSQIESKCNPFTRKIDTRKCILCFKKGDSNIFNESRLLYYGFDSWVHANCAMWSMGVYEEFDGSLQNVHIAFNKGRLIKCSGCKCFGATIKCSIKSCCNYYHFNCAKNNECLFECEKQIFCPLHNIGHEKANKNNSNNINKPLHIECNKSHKKYVKPFDVQFMIGSLSVNQLGNVYPRFSDTSEAIVPINFICTRLYWSIKEPWKIVQYTVRTSIQNYSVTLNNEFDIHFTVDHSKNSLIVERELCLISSWQKTLVLNNDTKTNLNNDYGTVLNQVDYSHETVLNAFTSTEDKNSSKLLPCENGETAFKDLKNDTSDGVSMLNIFPKLMIHENVSLGTQRKQPSYGGFLVNSIKKKDTKHRVQKLGFQRNNSQVFLRNKHRSSNYNLSCIVANKKFLKQKIPKLMQLDGADDHIFSNIQTQNGNTKLPFQCYCCDYSNKTFDCLQKRNIMNCEEKKSRERQSDISSGFLDVKNTVIISNDNSNASNRNIYSNQFLSNQTAPNSVDVSNYSNVITSESVLPQNFTNPSSIYVNINNDGYSSCGRTNFEKNKKEKKHFQIVPNNEQQTIFDKIKKQTDKTNYTKLLDQNIAFNQQKEQSLQKQFFIIQQNAGNSHPIPVQHMPIATANISQNIYPVSFLGNTIQYATVPAFTHSIVQAPIWQPDYNIALSTGLQIISLPSLQLASSSPQLVGCLNIPQTLQIASDQHFFGGSAMDLMWNSNQMCLAPQSMYSGLETIVKNTVMSSQQYVSTAIQGVLGQNSSFSATTTQVFQSSNTEPINNPLNNYVLFNNVDGSTIFVPQTNIPSEFLNTNIALEFNNGCNPELKYCTETNPRTFIQQSEASGILQQSPLLSEVTNSSVQIPIKHIQRKICLGNSLLSEQDLRLAPLAERNFQKKNLVENILQSTTFDPMKKPEGIPQNAQYMVNENICSNEKNEIFEVQNITSALHDNTTSNNLIIKRKLNVPKNSLENENSNKITARFFELEQKSSLKGIKVSSDSSNRIIHDTISPLKLELKNFKDNDGYSEQMKPESLNSPKRYLSRFKSPETLTTSFGNNQHNIPTNIVVPFMQAKERKLNKSRPTNKVFPLQSIDQQANSVNSVPNTFLISENVQDFPQLSNNLKTLIATEKVEFEEIKPTKTLSECKKRDVFVDSSEKVLAHVNILNSTPTLKKTNDSFLNIAKETYTYNKIEDPENPSDNTVHNTMQKLGKQFQIDDEHNVKPLTKCKGYCDVILKNHYNQKDIPKIELSSITTNLKSSKYTTNDLPICLESIKSTNMELASEEALINIEGIGETPEPHLIYEIQSEDGFCYKSQSISTVWEKVFEGVQSSRRAHGFPSVPIEPFAEISGVQILGLKTNALRYIIEQLPGTDKCQRYTPKYHKKISQNLENISTTREVIAHKHCFGSVRCEAFTKRSSYDMFSWLASKHRKQPKQIFVQPSDTELIARRCTANLPMAMKYRTLKETARLNVGVFRSVIHGRGLFCIKDLEAGEMVIEYAGELIRSTLADKKERYYDRRGIGCYMFKIDEQYVVDATMRGNAARFINHSCEPNCYSKVVDILGHKHIIIFSLRRIVRGEELTYDYKFPFEDIKIHCYCASKKCRKYLN